jgi:hypothetical protein
MNTITRNHVSRPVDRAARVREEQLRQGAIYAFGCYQPDMKFTLEGVVGRFGYRKDTAWLSIHRLVKARRVRVVGTVNRQIEYQIVTRENL